MQITTNLNTFLKEETQMALTQTQVSQLYVALFGRASEGEGNTFWQAEANQATAANAMLATSAASTYFGTSLNSNQAFVEHIYLNTLGKTATQDPDGIAFWVSALATNSRGFVVAELIKSATDVATAGAAQDQFNNRVEVSNYMAATVQAAPADYATSTAFTSAAKPTGALNVTNDDATVTTAKAEVDTLTIDGTTFTLTTGTDSFVGTAASDLFTSANGTLAAADTILDSSSTDHDIMNAEVTVNGLAPRLQNIETINVNGKYTTTGIDLASISGTTDLNLTTSIVGGTATVTNAATINAANINAGSSISTLSVTATASGTRGTVNVNGGAANVLVQGGSALDAFDVTTTGNVTIGSVVPMTSIDTVVVNLSDAATTITGDTALGSLTINQTGVAGVVTVGGRLTEDVTAVATAKTTVTGDKDLTIKVANLDVTDTAIVNTGTGTLTVKITDSAAAIDLVDVQANVVDFSVTGAGTYTTNANSTVKLTADLGAGVFNQGNTTGATALAAGAGTLVMQVAQSQATSTTTGAQVGTLLLSANPDTAADTANSAVITLADLALHANTNTVVISGSDSLTLTALSNNGDEVISAANMTGVLKIVTVDAASTMVLGSGNDVIGTVSGNTVTGVQTIHAGAGNDTIVFGAAAGASTIDGQDGNDTITLTGSLAANTVTGGAGNDTITGGTVVDTIDAGAGDDVINGAAGADLITTGTGTDTITIASTEDDDVIADFTLGTDVIVLTGAAVGATTITVADATVASSVYSEFGTAHTFTLTGVTATDLSSAVRLGSASAAFVALAASTITAGSLADNISTAANNGVNTIVLGAGDDKFTGGSGIDTITGGEGNDTFIVGSAQDVIKDLSGGDIVQSATSGFLATVTADWTATASSTLTATAGAEGTLTLNEGISVNADALTLDAATSGLTFTVKTTNTTASTITGTKGADVINGGDAADTLSGNNGDDAIVAGKGDDTITGGEGADTITGGLGSDTINLTEQVTAVDTVKFALTTEGADTISGFVTGSDVLTFAEAAFVTTVAWAAHALDVTVNANNYAETATALSTTGQDLDGTAGAGADGFIVVGAATGTAGVSIYWTTDMSDTTTTNSTLIATLTGINTTQIADTDFVGY